MTRLIVIAGIMFLMIFQANASEQLLDIIVPQTKKIQPADQLTCYWIKREYNNCFENSGWSNTDVFGFYLPPDGTGEDNQSHRDALSKCNAISAYLKESGCL